MISLHILVWECFFLLFLSDDLITDGSFQGLIDLDAEIAKVRKEASPGAVELGYCNLKVWKVEVQHNWRSYPETEYL